MTFSIIFLLFAAVVLPLAACVAAALLRRSAKPVLLGAACFLIFQVCTRLPLLELILPKFAWYTAFSSAQPVIYTALVALSAGLFEECGRYIVMRLFMKGCRPGDSIAFGVGHGAVEAILFTGVNAVALAIMGGAAAASPGECGMAGLERIFAMGAHIGFSLIVWCSLEYRKPMLLILAVLMHGALDFIAVSAAGMLPSIYVSEAVTGVLCAATLVCAYLIYKHISKTEVKQQ